MQEKNRNKLLQWALELALKHPESGVLQELAFMNEIELQAAIEVLERLLDD